MIVDSGYLAMGNLAAIEPLKKAILVDVLDSSTASARVPERVADLAGTSADPTLILLLLLRRHASADIGRGSSFFSLLLRRRRR